MKAEAKELPARTDPDDLALAEQNLIEEEQVRQRLKSDCDAIGYCCFTPRT